VSERGRDRSPSLARQSAACAFDRELWMLDLGTELEADGGLL
jgi:hypothetical protein